MPVGLEKNRLFDRGKVQSNEWDKMMKQTE
jgi:hypothetical protein